MEFAWAFIGWLICSFAVAIILMSDLDEDCAFTPFLVGLAFFWIWLLPNLLGEFDRVSTAHPITSYTELPNKQVFVFDDEYHKKEVTADRKLIPIDVFTNSFVIYDHKGRNGFGAEFNYQTLDIKGTH